MATKKPKPDTCVSTTENYEFLVPLEVDLPVFSDLLELPECLLPSDEEVNEMIRCLDEEVDEMLRRLEGEEFTGLPSGYAINSANLPEITSGAPTKKRSVTIRLENRVIDGFKAMAKAKKIPYQTLINRVLLRAISESEQALK